MPRAIQINPLPDDTGTDFHPFWANELTGNNFNGQILHYNFNGMFNGVLWLNDDELNPTGGQLNKRKNKVYSITLWPYGAFG